MPSSNTLMLISYLQHDKYLCRDNHLSAHRVHASPGAILLEATFYIKLLSTAEYNILLFTI